MEPEPSLQPDPPDDDPDQDTDHPPPQSAPVFYDSALSLVAQPLASAAARVAATQPLAFPLDGLNDLEVNLNWGGTDIESLFLNETQYIQLGEDQPPPSPPVAQTPSSLDATTNLPPQQQTPRPDPLPTAPFVSPPSNDTDTATATATAADTATAIQPAPDSSLEQTTAFSQPPGPSDITQNDSQPQSRPRPAAPIQKRARTRLTQPLPKQNPIPIAPRSASKVRSLPEPKLKSAPPTPRSMQAQSSPLKTLRSQSTPPIHNLEHSPASASRDSHLAQIPANQVTHLPFTASPIPAMPTNSMYPLQHHQFVFQSSPPAASPADLNTPGSAAFHAQNASNPPEQKKMRLSKSHSPHTVSPSASKREPHRQQPASQQSFLSPAMQIMPPGVLPFEAGIMPFFPMGFASAKYPQGVIPTVPASLPAMPSSMLNAFAPGSGQIVQNEYASVAASAADASTRTRLVQHPPSQHPRHPGRPIIVQEGVNKLLVPQQTAARLERHPVLGRLQLKSSQAPQVATSAGLRSRVASETQSSIRDNQQRKVVDSIQGGSSASKAGSSSAGSREGTQTQQKKRLVWTPELHERFVKAISAVGLSQAVPKTLVTIMNVEGLTTEHVKSHLQKYRNSLKKEAAEEEGDRGRRNPSSPGSQNLKLRTPSMGGASGIHSGGVVTPSVSVKNRTELHNSGLMTDHHRPRGLPILPSRINAFGNPVEGNLQPAVQAQISAAKEVKSSSDTATAVESIQRETEVISPRPCRTVSAQTPEALQVDGSGISAEMKGVRGPNFVSRTIEGDAIQVDTKDRETDTDAGAADSNRGDAAAQRKYTRTDSAEVGGQEVGNGATSGPVIGPQGDMTKSQREDVKMSEEHRMGAGKVGDGGSRDSKMVSMSNRAVEEDGSKSQETKDLEFELMKENTQQMQLQVQMMLYRTIAMEKKLGVSERMKQEGSGTADGSKQSAVGDISRREMANKDVGSKTEDGGIKAGGKDGSKTVQEQEEAGDAEKTLVASKKHGEASSSNEQTAELVALLNAQRGLQKQLEAASVMIEKRMKRHLDRGKADDGGGSGGGEEERKDRG